MAKGSLSCPFLANNEKILTVTVTERVRALLGPACVKVLPLADFLADWLPQFALLLPVSTVIPDKQLEFA